MRIKSLSEKRLIVEGKVNNKIAQFLIDTGACIGLIDEDKVKYAEEYFDKHGAMSTIIGRLVPAVRQLISIPAGLARMSLSRFLLFTCIGAGAWNIVLAILGYWMSKIPGMDSEAAVMAKVKEHSTIIGYVFIALAIFIVGFLLYKGLKKHKKQE